MYVKYFEQFLRIGRLMKKINEKSWLRYLLIAIIVVLSFFDALAASAMLLKNDLAKFSSASWPRIEEQAFLESADYICINNSDGLYYANSDGKFYRLDTIEVCWTENFKYSLIDEERDAIEKNGHVNDTVYTITYDYSVTPLETHTTRFDYNEVAGAYVCSADRSAKLNTKLFTVNEYPAIAVADIRGKYFFIKYPSIKGAGTFYVFKEESFDPEDASSIEEWENTIVVQYYNDFYTTRNRLEEHQTRQAIYNNLSNVYGKNPEYVFFALSGIIILLGLFVLYSVGHKKDFDGIYLTVWDNVAWSIHAAFMAGIIGIAALPVLIIDELSGSNEMLRLIIAICFTCAISVLACGWFLETTIVRLKAKCFWRTTATGYLLRLLKEPCKKLIHRIMDYRQNKKDGLLGIDRLANETAAIARGEIENVNLSTISPHYRFFAENINTLAEGKTRAVEEMLKSERMRVELITNVSHDIKTPLTSIISYTELLSQKDIEDAEALEYLEIISGQSKRLKTLLEDLIEASKASTGVLKVKAEELLVDILLTQILCEYEDQMKAKKLQVISNLGSDIRPVTADGKHLSRVLYNIFTNVTKYALEGSRVYVDVVQTDRTIITVKNTSASQLNISADELKERFMRGDSSRTTEGSGLGLAIAESLMELMGGKLEVCIDGDLFKVSLVL